jgi:hypothetical protein
MVRWLGDIEPALIPGFAERSPIDQFATFYNLRMGRLHRTRLPILTYECFVTEPERMLRSLLAEMGCAFDAATLRSHERYSDADVGHGGIALGSAIHRGSLDRYREVVTRDEFDEIVERTREVHQLYGYRLTWAGVDFERGDGLVRG